MPMIHRRPVAPWRRGGLALAAAAALAGPAHAVPFTVNVTDEQGKPVEHAVVSVLVKGAPEKAAAGTAAELAQRNRAFVPYVLVVQTGTAVSLPNFDTVRHHVYSFSPVKTFEIKLYVGTPVAPVVFDKPGTAVLGCNIHDQMAAYVHVVDTPYFARSDGSGRAQLDVPAGEHRVRVWHPGMRATGTPVEAVVKIGPADSTLRLKVPDA